MSCLGDLEVLALVEGIIEAEARETMLRHADSCPDCRAMLVAIGRNVSTTRSAPSVAGDEPVIARGATVGRYIVMELVGVGAMGEVHSAFDPVLERKVALKLLRDAGAHDLPGKAGAIDRLIGEGKTMARLSHPNIVPVFDVGTFGDRLYVAMELVDGRTLREWLAEEPRTWRAVAAAFAHAGRGLEAAHAQDIVHRDFKPENVLVGRDGRVRVADFGLAREAGGNDNPVVGTPAYMAPESLDRGGALSPLHDQFAFCVALYEALYGVRPFDGDSVRAIADAARAGTITPPPPTAARVPAWLHRIALRGIAAKPEDRFPSMTALLAELERDPSRRVGAALFGLGALAIVGMTVALVAGQRHAGPSCDVADFAAWTADRKAATHAAFAATHEPYAAATTLAVDRALDAYAAAWQAQHREACTATQRGDQSAELLDLRMACLRDRERDVAALVELFAHADADVAQRAVQSVDALPPLAACADGTALRAPLAPPRGATAEVDRIRGELAAVVALRGAGKFTAGLARARPALAAARGLAFAPLVAEAAYATGLLEADAGDAKTGVVTLDDAARAAAEGHDDPVATEVLIDLARIESDKLQHYDAAAALVQPATWSIVRFGSDPILLARMLDVQAFVLEGQGKHADASPIFEHALAIREHAHGAASVDVGKSVLALAENRRLLHRYPEAYALYARGLAILEAALGPDHPDVAVALNDLGSAQIEAGHTADARAPLLRALAIRRAALGDKHPDVARTLSNLANVANDLHELDAALDYANQALAVKEATLGPDHPSLAFTLTIIADVELHSGKPDAALAHVERALAIREKALGPTHPYVLESLVYDARVRLERHEPKPAIPLLERATTELDKKDDDPASRGEARYLLGRALWEAGEDRPRATALVKAARADLVKSGDRGAEILDDLDKWVRQIGAGAVFQ